MFRKIQPIVTLSLLSMSVVNAATFSSSSETSLALGDTVRGDYWIGAGEVTISGAVLGDLIVASQEINVPGHVYQDVFAASQHLSIEGQVDGDVVGLFSEVSVKGSVTGGLRVGAKVVFIEGHVAGDIFAGASEVIVAENAVVDGELYVYANSLWINGEMGGQISGDVGKAVIAGRIDNDVHLTIQHDLELDDGAQINGSLTYKAKKELIPIDSAGVSGDIHYLPLPPKRWMTPFRLFKMVWAFLGAFIVGMIFKTFWRNGFENTTILLKTEPIKTIATGSVFFIIVPLVAVGSMILLVTIPGALLVLTVYAIVLYLAKIFLAYFIGQTLFRATESTTTSTTGPLFVGLLVVYVVINLPMIGDFLSVVALVIGTGAIVRAVLMHLLMRASNKAIATQKTTG